MILLYFPVFHFLNEAPIVIWDESLFSLRALHLSRTGEYLPNFNIFNDLPDHRNTKLPFTTVIQALSLKIFGINELAIRLPISFIFLGTALYMVYHFKARFNNVFAGYIFGLVAITAYGFVKPHVLRTGDQDVPYACYLLIAAVSFLSYLEKQELRALIGFVFFSIAAVLTKNLLAGLIAPGIIVYLIATKRLISIVTDWKFLMACFLIAAAYVGVVGYYEYAYPGFFDRMWNYELMGRYSGTIEEHYQSKFYYLDKLARKFLNPYLYFIPFIFIASFKKGMDPKLRSGIQYFTSIALFYLLIVSQSKTQTDWYVVPIYLFVAYIIAVGSIPVMSWLKSVSRVRRIAIVSVIPVLWFWKYGDILKDNVFRVNYITMDTKYGMFIPQVRTFHPEVKSFTIVDTKFGTSAYFYKEMYEAKGMDIDYRRTMDFGEGERVMVCSGTILEPIGEKHEFEIIRQWEECKLIEIRAVKN